MSDSVDGAVDVGGRPLVIGVGNPERGDDGIGPAVVAELRRRGADADTTIADGDLTGLVLLWEARDVVVVDACTNGQPVGTITEVDPHRLDGVRAMSTHGVDIAFAVRLAERLGRSPRRLRIVGVEGAELGHGPLSPQLAARVGTIADALTV